MTTLTKDQIGKLNPEQQETLATMELQQFAKRRRLLTDARGSLKLWWSQVRMYLFSACCSFAALLISAADWHERFCVLMGASGVLILVGASEVYIGKRINSLIELLDLEGNKADHKS